MAKKNTAVQASYSIEGAECPSCGRDNSGEYGDLCTAEDCPGVMVRAAGPGLLAALMQAQAVLAAYVNHEPVEMCAMAEAECAARVEIAKAVEWKD